MYQFDHDTQVTEVAPGRYRGQVTDRWAIHGVPNGGYLMAIGVAGLSQVMPRPDPLTVTAHFVAPARPGPIEVAVEVIKAGKKHATAMARLIQGDEIARILVSFGDLSAASGPTFVAASPPEIPPPDHPRLRSNMPGGPEITHRFDQRYDPDTVGWFDGQPSGRPELRAWQRFADGRPPDLASLVLFADALPPPIFDVIEPGWAPTLELTVHLRAHPAPGWLRSRFTTRFLYDGYLEEDGELWDEGGRLVALSRQLATVPRAAPG